MQVLRVSGPAAGVERLPPAVVLPRLSAWRTGGRGAPRIVARVGADEGERDALKAAQKPGRARDAQGELGQRTLVPSSLSLLSKLRCLAAHPLSYSAAAGLNGMPGSPTTPRLWGCVGASA